MSSLAKLLIALAVVGAGIGIAYALTRSSNNYNPVPYAPDYARNFVPTNSGSEPPVYQNHEEITFPDGFDPDTLMPRKIVVVRNYKVRVA